MDPPNLQISRQFRGTFRHPPSYHRNKAIRTFMASAGAQESAWASHRAPRALLPYLGDAARLRRDAGRAIHGRCRASRAPYKCPRRPMLSHSQPSSEAAESPSVVQRFVCVSECRVVSSRVMVPGFLDYGGVTGANRVLRCCGPKFRVFVMRNARFFNDNC